MLIRPAAEPDVPGILTIYNDIVVNSTATYNDTPVTLDNRLDWFHSRIRSGYPVLVATDHMGTILGFSSFGDFRTWPGYRFSVEHTIHIHPNHRNQGIGTQLILQLLPIARSLGKHVIIGGIDSENTGSIRLHERLGFKRVAHLPEVGFKFNRWLDLVLLQRIL
jgi:L-amino acid N-acyltransferase